MVRDKSILRCDRCGEVIGVYEPLVVAIDGREHRASLAAEPELAFAPGEHYHRSCYEDGRAAGEREDPS